LGNLLRTEEVREDGEAWENRKFAGSSLRNHYQLS